MAQLAGDVLELLLPGLAEWATWLGTARLLPEGGWEPEAVPCPKWRDAEEDADVAA